ncbi:MAG: type II toxin-antitoxin system death-on-curing family toxin [Oscillochloridaceae bacterium umkhey_bin13]
MHYLTRDDLLDLHTFAVERYGGLLGIKSQDRLQAVVAAPRQVMFGTELYPDLCSKGAVMVYMIVKNHPFLGANEATALFALLRLLALNGASLRPDIGPGELAFLFRALNHSDLNRESLEVWLRERIIGPGETP